MTPKAGSQQHDICVLRHGPQRLKFVRPEAILLNRHAEKPADEADVHLSPQGKKRADALPDLFKKSDARPDPFPASDFIIAAKPSKRSNRRSCAPGSGTAG